MVPLATRNLFADKRRFAMSVAGVAFAVLLVLIVLSLYRGWSDVGRLYEQLPGELWLSQPATSDPFHSTSFLPLGDGARASHVPGVRAAIPVYTRHIAFDLHGHSYDVFAMALGVRHGTYAIPPGGIDIDRMLAQDAGIGVGDRLDVLGRALHVVRVHSGGNSIFQTAFLNAADARAPVRDRRADELLPARPAAGRRLGRRRCATRRRPAGHRDAHEQAVRAQLRRPRERRLPRRRRRARGDRLRCRRCGHRAHDLHRDCREGARVRRLEGDRGFGPLPAAIVLRQSLVAAVAVAAANLIKRDVPEFITVLTLRDALAVLAVALATAVLASFVPVRRLERIDPAEAFRP